ncbi:MAG: ABC transporter substrate-binding protein [Nitrososphaerota archaeon]
MRRGSKITRREILKYLASGVIGAGIGTAAGYSLSPPKVFEVPVTSQPRKAPEYIKIGIVTFLSGPGASWFGIEGAKAAEYCIEKINEKGGIGGVKIKYTIVDESGGPDANVVTLKRLHEEEKCDVVIGWISSADALAVAPVADELGQLAIIYDAGTNRLFEERRYKFVFRTKSHLVIDAVGAAFAAVKLIPDLKRVGVLNQDYAWGRDNATVFLAAIKKLKPDVEIVSEYYSKLYETDYTPFITKLMTDNPQFVYSSYWGGDLIAFVKQAAGYGLFKRILFAFNCGNNSLQALGRDFPEGILVGHRGPHWIEYPDPNSWPLQKEFVEGFYAKYGVFPVYPAYHMWQAIYAYKAAVEKAIEITGEWPDIEDIIKAFENLVIMTPNGHLIMREDHNGVESMLYGLSIHTPKYPFPAMKDPIIFPPELVNPPVNVSTLEWINSW